MYISNKQFVYDGFPSHVYGLRFAWLETSPDTILSATKDYSYIKNKSNNKFTISKTNYENPLEFNAEIISSRVLKEHEVREVYQVFFNKNSFKELFFPNDFGENIYLNCILIATERIEGGVGDSFGVVGFKVNIKCDAPWGWSEDIITRFVFKNSVSDNNTDATIIPYTDKSTHSAYFSIYNYSDTHEYIYPEVVVTTLKEGDIDRSSKLGSNTECFACPYRNTYCWKVDSTNIPKKAMIQNLTDSSSRGTCIFWNEETGGKGSALSVKMNPATGIIRGNTADMANRISNTNKKFIRLVPGENKFYVENISEIEFKFKEARILV